MDALGEAIADLIVTSGPIGFDEYVAHALYTPGLGFYAAGGGAGRRRDFLTSPEVGPLFGAVLASALDSWWSAAGEPEHFHVVEAGAGPGTLARSIIAAQPRCARALELVLVEPAVTQHSTHPAGVSSRTTMPTPAELADTGVVVLANELLDNLPFGLVEFTEAGWQQVCVDVEGSGTGRRFVTRHAQLDPGREAWCRAKAVGAVEVGSRMPVLAEAADWLGHALDLARLHAGGRVVVIDYASTSPAMARRPWSEWVRTYARHGRAGDPLVAPGSCDITVEVAVDQLAAVAAPAEDRSQAEFLVQHGIEALVTEGARRWRELGIAGGIEAIAARSRVHESEALLDESGLGAFRVLEWFAL